MIQPTVTIHGERGDEWERVCGQRTFPVISIQTVLADLPGKPGAEVYLLDFTKLDAPVRAKLCWWLANRFELPLAHVEVMVQQQGVPILAEQCTATADMRMFV